ncbi:MAG: amidohydrolase [Anaerolineales bacterium]|nr:amidohydrolase [Anaerolineales bacterium]
MSKHHHLTRRDFLKLAGAGIGGAILACGKGTALTAFPGTPAISVSIATQIPATFPPGSMADTILVNGQIRTADAMNSITQGLAIKGDKILMTGNDDAIRSLTATETKVIDLAGRTVTPGFTDPHIHFRALGLMTTYYTPFIPPDVKDIPSLQRALADYIKGKKDGEWIMGYYLALADKPIPTKEDLDPISKNNPVFIMHIGGHWGTANSVAMQFAKITSNTSSPDGGIIEKKGGELTGVFYNHRAMDVLRVYAPPIGKDLIKEGILNTQTLMASCGVTSFHDNNIRSVEDIRAYQQLSQEGKLFLRNDLYLTLEWPKDMEKVDQVEVIQDGVTRFRGFKFLIDGQGPTAHCHEPHNGVEWRLPTWDPQMFKDTVKTLHDTGLQICVHCIGDAATDLVLEAYEAAMNTNPRPDPRHRIEHAVITTEQATQKMRDLGVVVSTQPAFIYLFGEGWKTLFNPQQMERIMVTREWINSGVHLAIGSDAPSTPLYNPQATLAGAISRLSLKQNVLGPDQVMTFAEALRAHTYEGAYAGHQENVKGTLETGKLADLVVWPEDPEKLSLRELVQTKTVDMTIVGGKMVYEKG